MYNGGRKGGAAFSDGPWWREKILGNVRRLAREGYKEFVITGANLARYSDDNGVTWSEPIDLTRTARDMADGRWRISVPGPGGAIQNRTGRLIVPMWRFAPWGTFTLFSDDHGRTWQRGERRWNSFVRNHHVHDRLSFGCASVVETPAASPMCRHPRPVMRQLQGRGRPLPMRPGLGRMQRS